MKNRLLTGWDFRRWFYLGLGIFVIIMAIIDREWTLAIPGVYFASMAIFSFGCAAGNCAIPPQKFSGNTPTSLSQTQQP